MALPLLPKGTDEEKNMLLCYLSQKERFLCVVSENQHRDECNICSLECVSSHFSLPSGRL